MKQSAKQRFTSGKYATEEIKVGEYVKMATKKENLPKKNANLFDDKINSTFEESSDQSAARLKAERDKQRDKEIYEGDRWGFSEYEQN